MGERTLVEKLRSFSSAYPEDVFTPITQEECSKLPRGTSDRISASMGRHCAKYMSEAADEIERHRRAIEFMAKILRDNDWMDHIEPPADIADLIKEQS